MLKKPRPKRYPAFKAWIMSGRCACWSPVLRGCGGPEEFHHYKRRGAAGSDSLLGGSDLCGMKLCRNHHNLEQARQLDFEWSLGCGVWEFLMRQLVEYLEQGGTLEVRHDPSD